MANKPQGCTVLGCPDFLAVSVEPCAMHLAREQKGSRNAKYAGALRDGTRTEAINVRCAPDLKKAVKARARSLGISEGRAAEDLLRRGLDPKSCPYHPFCPRKT